MRTGAPNDVACLAVEVNPQILAVLTAEIKSVVPSTDFFDTMTYLE